MDTANYEPITPGIAMDIAVAMGDYMTKYGRINVLNCGVTEHSYVVLNVHIGLNSLVELLYPRGPGILNNSRWWMHLIDIGLSPLLGLLRPLIVRWQIAVYATAYKKMLETYPLYQHNIMMFSQYPEAVQNALNIK